MKHDFVIQLLGPRHSKDKFDCGDENLNRYLQNYAGQNSRRGLGKTFVAVRPGESEVCGYYTLSSGSVEFEHFIEKLPRYPIPTALLGRLAVDKSMHGQGLGSLLH